MSILTGILIYVIIWWMVFFMALPFGVERPDPEDVEIGHEPGAPKNPMLLKKAIITSIIAGILVAVWWFIQDQGYITLSA